MDLLSSVERNVSSGQIDQNLYNNLKNDHKSNHLNIKTKTKFKNSSDIDTDICKNQTNIDSESQKAQQVFYFLNNINVHVFEYKFYSNLDLIYNPYRNGVVFNEILLRVLKQKVNYIKHPKTLNDCDSNVNKSLKLLDKFKNYLPPKLLESSKNYLVGKTEFIFNLILSIYNLFRNRFDNNDIEQEYFYYINSNKNKTLETNLFLLPYDRKSLNKLDKSIVQWLYIIKYFENKDYNNENKSFEIEQNNILTCITISKSKNYISDIKDYLPSNNNVNTKFSTNNKNHKNHRKHIYLSEPELTSEWSSGSILLYIVEKYYNTLVKGAFPKPQTESLKKNNINKCLDILRREKRLDKRCVCKDAHSRILECDFGFMIGFLEDLHILWDGKTRIDVDAENRQKMLEYTNINDNYDCNVKLPYLPYDIPIVQDKKEKEKYVRKYNSREVIDENSEYDILSPNTNTINNTLTQSLGNLLSEESRTFNRTEKYYDKNTIKNDLNSLQNKNSNKNKKVIRTRLNIDKYDNVKNVGHKENNEILSDSSDLEHTNQNQEMNQTASNDLYLMYKSHKTEESQQKLYDQKCKKYIDFFALFEIKLSINQIQNSELFRNGVMLMNLAEKLEKRSFLNWTDKPKNRAHSLKNIKRALDIFKQNKTMSLKWLLCEDEIYEGNMNAIFGLLDDLQDAYKLEINYVRKMKARKNPSTKVYTKNNFPLTTATTTMVSMNDCDQIIDEHLVEEDCNEYNDNENEDHYKLGTQHEKYRKENGSDNTDTENEKEVYDYVQNYDDNLCHSSDYNNQPQYNYNYNSKLNQIEEQDTQFAFK